MIIGIPKEIKNNENRVAMTPAGVFALVRDGHKVYVEKNAGEGSGFSDEDYINAGAKILDKSTEVFEIADMIVKVKEPLESEYSLFKEGQILFTYLHLAPCPSLTKVLLDKKVTGIAYETVQLKNGCLPLLVPMSEVAGRMAVQIGATMLQTYNGGSGMLLGGVPGVLSAEVVIVGGGVVGTNAAKMAVGMGANVTVMDINQNRLAYLDDIFGGRLRTLVYNEFNVTAMAKQADLLIGAVLVAGAKAPKIIKENMVKDMKKGSVIVDVAIDQGGSVETIDRITTHDNPTFEKYGVIHYSVANMPGAVPRTSTFALTNSTLPYVLKLANENINALKCDDAFMLGLNTHNGKLTNAAVAEAMGLEFVPPETAMQ